MISFKSERKPVFASYYRRHSLCQNVSIKGLAGAIFPPLINTKSLTALYTNQQCFVHSNSEQYIRMQ